MKRSKSSEGRLEGLDFRDFLTKTIQTVRGRDRVKVSDYEDPVVSTESVGNDQVSQHQVNDAADELVKIYRTLASGSTEDTLAAHRKLNLINKERIKVELDHRFQRKAQRNNVDCLFIEPPGNIVFDPTVRPGIMKNLLAIVHVKFALGDSLVNFIDQVNQLVDSVSSLNSGEYNLLVFTLLSKSAKDRLAGLSSPAKMKTNDFLKVICFYLETTKSRHDKIKELYSYKPSKSMNTIQEMLGELTKLGDQAFPSDVNRRNEVIFETLKSNVPSGVKSKLTDILDEHFLFNPEGNYPGINQLIEYITPNLVEINNAMIRPSAVRKIISEDVQNDKNQSGEIQKVEKIPNRSPCTVCKNINHSAERCFKNPLSKYFKGKHSCLLCRGEHPSPNCSLYQNISPCAEKCTYCAELLGREYFHSNVSCLVKKKLEQ